MGFLPDLNYLYLAIFIGLTLVAYFSLTKGNFPKPTRYRQWLSPILALVATFIAGYYYFYDEHLNLFKFWEDLIKGYGLRLPPINLVTKELLFAFQVVLIFATVKMTVNQFIFKRSKYQSNYLPSLPDPEGKSKPDYGYYVNGAQYILLRQGWEFIRLFFGLCLVLGLLIYAVSIYFGSEDMTFPPALFLLPVMVLAEVWWFLEGPKNVFETEEDTIKGTGPNIQNMISFRRLWETYQHIWGRDKLLLAWHKSHTKTFENPQPIEKMDIEDAKALALNGFPLSETQYQIFSDIYNQKDVIIKSIRYEELAPVLFAGLLRKLLNGKHILILIPKIYFANKDYHEEVVRWIRKWLQQLTGSDVFWAIQSYDRTMRGKLEAKIVVSSAEELLEHGAVKYEWFNNLQTVVFFYGAKTFAAAPSSSNILFNILKEKNPTIQSIVLTDNRRDIQPSVKRNLEIRPEIREWRILTSEPSELYLLFWKEEGPNIFQNNILKGDIEAFLGAEAALALPAWQENLDHIELVQQDHTPYYECLEEVKNNKDRLLDNHLNAQLMQGNIHDKIICNDYHIFTKSKEAGFFIARDSEYNLVTCLEKWSSYSRNMGFLNIVSPPYVLREYFMDNLPYFQGSPIPAFTSFLMSGRFSIAMTLLEQLVHLELTESQIKHILKQADIEVTTVRQTLEKLFRAAFNIDLQSGEFLSKRKAEVFSELNNNYETVYYYSLNPSIKNQMELQFVQNVEIGEQYQRNVLKIYPYDLLFQNYLPGQYHSFHGRMYEIEEYDPQNRFLRTNNVNPSNILSYRPDLTVHLKTINPPQSAAYTIHPQDGLSLSLCESRFEVETNGFFSFITGIHLKNVNYDFAYQSLNKQKVPIRKYHLGRVLTIDIQTKLRINIPQVGATLTVLLKEVLYTLFPDSHQYLIVTCPTNEGILKNRFAQLFPNLVLSEMAKQSSSAPLQFYLFEDAHQDLGLVHRVYKDWKVILSVLEDYLDWLLTAEKKSKQDDFKPLRPGEYRKSELNKTAFLKYGFKEYPEFLNLPHTQRLLKSIIGENNLHRERTDFRTGKKFRSKGSDAAGAGMHQCDFCGKQYPSTLLEKFLDGRERCKNCKATGVDSPEQLKALYLESLNYFRSMKINLISGIDIHFQDTDVIQEKNGGVFRPTPEFDPRAIGLAVQKGSAYSIWIENGQPRHKTISTIVHELTHIWQYTNLKYRQMEKDYGKLLIEGHTTWTEIDFLNKNKLSPEYVESLKNQQNEYGEGYKLVVKLLQENPEFKKNPFLMLKTRYGL